MFSSSITPVLYNLLNIELPSSYALIPPISSKPLILPLLTSPVPFTEEV